MDRVILHCDLNNFYASVEQKLHPEFDGLPLAVCGNPKVRHGIILAKNQLAKQCGVQTGEAIWMSKQKCPSIVFVEPHFDEYVAISKQVYAIYKSFTDRVESFGIDECWLDVTESGVLFGSGEEIADKLRSLVKQKTGLTISVGVSFTKVLAKLGSDMKKPDATTVLKRDGYMALIGNMSPSELIMIGKKTAQKLEKLNVHTISQLAAADRGMLRSHFGVIGDNMVDAAQGVYNDEVKLSDFKSVPKSVSNGTTTPRDMTGIEDATVVIYALCELVAVRLREYGLVANGIGLYLRDTLLRSTSRQRSLPLATSNASDLAQNAIRLFKDTCDFSTPLRTVTVAAIRLSENRTQLSLFDEENDREEKLEKSIDAIREKYGYHSVKRGVLLSTDLALNLHDDDDFRPFHQSKDT